MQVLIASVAARNVLLWCLVVLFCVLVATALLTIGRSVRAARRDRREEAVEEGVTPALFTRLACDEPEWAEWVDDLSPAERWVLERRVDRYLRVLTGEDRGRLAELASHLEPGRRARRPFDAADRIERLGRLSWLALLDHPIDAPELVADCSDHPDERAATARVLYARNAPEASTLGTGLLVRTGRSLSLFGLDTLYRLNRSDPRALLDAGATKRGEWTDAFLAQVLDVVAHCAPTLNDAPIEWLFTCLSHEEGAVRAAAIRAIETYAWREEVQSRLAIVWLVADDDPVVRRAVYRYLAAYGDASDVGAILDAATAEPDARALLIVASELTEQLRDADTELTPDVRRSLRWVSAERDASGRTRSKHERPVRDHLERGRA